MKIEVDRLHVSEVQALLDKAYTIVFGHQRPDGDKYSDMALVARDEEQALLGFATARIFDSETVFVSFAGILPGARGREVSYLAACALRDDLFKEYKRITGLVDSENIVALSMGFKLGFRIVGSRIHEGKLLIELLAVKS